MKSYDPITALYYAWGHLTAENSNQMKELQSRQFIFVNTTVTIFNITTRGARMRELFLFRAVVSARNAAMSLTTLAVRIIVHIRSKRVSSLSTYFIFTRASIMISHITSSSNEICANKSYIWSWTRWHDGLLWYTGNDTETKIQRRVNRK